MPQSSCSVDVCFMLEGSDAIQSKIFDMEKDLVEDIVKKLPTNSGRIGLSAVQFSATNSAISGLTNQATSFLDLVFAEPKMSYSKAFVTGGLNYCFSLLKASPRKTAIVFIGNGENSVGVNPAERAALFSRAGVKVLAVGVGYKMDWRGLKSIAMYNSHLFSVKPWQTVGAAGDDISKKLCA